MAARGKKPGLFEMDGRKQTLKEWAAEYGIEVHVVRTRLCSSSRAWTLREALTQPARVPTQKMGKKPRPIHVSVRKRMNADERIEQEIRKLRIAQAQLTA